MKTTLRINQTLRSMVFFHVPKTGGTSATATLQPSFAASVTSSGNLSKACLGSRPGESGVLFHGHAEHDVARAVPPGAVTATLLRAPDEQAVSSYCHLLRNPHLPLHGPATRLGFSGLMRDHWQMLVFQAVSLDVAISTTPVSTPDDFFARLPAIRRFLDRINVVGCLDQIDTFLRDAARRTNHAIPPPAPRLNTAAEFGVDGREVERLRAEYQALAAIPLLRELMLAEAALISQAEARCNQWLKSWGLPIGALRACRPGAVPGTRLEIGVT